MSALSVLWEGTTQRAHDSATRGNWNGRVRGIQLKEYAVGDQFYRKRNSARVQVCAGLGGA